MKTIYYTDASGKKIPVNVNVNKKLDNKANKKTKKKDSKLKRKIAATALVISIGVGTVLGGCALFGAYKNRQTEKETTSTTTSTTETTNPTVDDNEINEDLRFNPNSEEAITDKAVLLIEEAAKCGKKIDAEDAVLATIVANSNELNAGFMGQLFGERAEQTYTYGAIVDAYLRVGMMQVENIGVAKDDEVIFNIENIFANKEDYEYLNNIRQLTTRFNNSTDEVERGEITAELNQIAFDLCTYEAYDISSPAGILAMLSLDGMRIVTNNSANPILHDDIRDEMFGDGDYACQKDATITADGQVFQTAYSYRVNDVKLDSIKSKLDNAVLEDGKVVILDRIINTVAERTKDIEISDFNAVDEINKVREENRDVTYEYESSPGVVKDNYSEKTDDDVVENVGGQDVIVVPGGNSQEPTKDEETPETTNPADDEPEQTTEPTNPSEDPVLDPTIQNPEVTPPEEPDITEEEDVEPEPGEDVIDTGDAGQNEEEAEDELEDEWEKAQADSNQGAIDGEYYGSNGLPKPSFEGKSVYYINAFNANYDFWYNLYLDALSATNAATTAETYDLDNLSKEELEALKDAALGTGEYSQEQEKTK